MKISPYIAPPADAVFADPMNSPVAKPDMHPPSPDALLPHTQRLLCAVLHGFIAGDNHYIATVFDLIVGRIRIELLDSKMPGINPHKTGNIMSNSEGVGAFRNSIKTSGGMELCITSSIEEPESGALVWGLIHVHRPQQADQRHLISALNWSLCAAYEETVSCTRAIADVDY
jgi:hypothetical protein